VTEKLEQLEHEKSLVADTPTGQLRDQVKSLSDTLSAQARDLEIARKDAEEVAKQMTEENTNLQCAPNITVCAKSIYCSP
jgi:hypothetical protein